MGIDLRHVVIVSAVLAAGAFVYVVGFEQMDENTNPRAASMNQTPGRGMLITRVRAMMAAKQLEGANRVADTLMEHYFDDPSAMLWRALVHRQMGDEADAIKMWVALDHHMSSLVSWPERYTQFELDYFRAWGKFGVGDIEGSQAIFGAMADRLEAQSSPSDGSAIRSSGALYNLACYRAMSGDAGSALEHWVRAVEFGYGQNIAETGWWAIDPDLESLHGEERFWDAGRSISVPAAGLDGDDG